MHIPFKALAVSLSFLSAPAFAAPAADPIKAISTATSWNEVIAQLETRFPKLIVDELRAAVKDEAFPTIRTYKGQLVVTGANGGRITLAFGKDGTALLNGKPLKIRPLATVGDEVKRLSDGEGKSASLMQYLIPDANAGGMIGSGMASLAFASSNAWKADACAEEKLTDELQQTCPLMGVGMVQLVADSDEGKPKDPYKPVGFQCPDVNGGVLELTRKAQSGALIRVKVTYNGDKATRVVMEVATPGSNFSVMKDGNPEKVTDPEDKRILNIGYINTHPVKETICDSPDPAIRRRYAAVLESNRQAMRNVGATPTKVNDQTSMQVN
jgi:hypothetical protein